ncbi:DNA ligase [Vibrio sp.]|uniref:DNA ligase n=1 Tax=Vibrio sp. TaxID=678 RepID=UPI00311F15F1
MYIKLSYIAIALMSALPCNADSYDADRKHLPLMHAGFYDPDIDLSQYWKSEKLDGIRAIWDGKTLQTRSGLKLNPPNWFIEALPSYYLEGELWAGRGNFNLVQTTVLDKTPIENAWRHIRFMVFDMPHSSASYLHRYEDIVQLVNSLQVEHIQFVEHTPISSEQELSTYFDQINAYGGEGVMLRKFSGKYQSGRGEQLLKMKQYHDAEATIIGYKMGKGKLSGLVGALLVQLDSGVQFYVGSGLSDELRKKPPRLGTTITYRHNGYTHKGIPKFARFLRERVDSAID